jgi:hypothetical protein
MSQPAPRVADVSVVPMVVMTWTHLRQAVNDISRATQPIRRAPGASASASSCRAQVLGARGPDLERLEPHPARMSEDRDRRRDRIDGRRDRRARAPLRGTRARHPSSSRLDAPEMGLSFVLHPLPSALSQAARGSFRLAEPPRPRLRRVAREPAGHPMGRQGHRRSPRPNAPERHREGARPHQEDAHARPPEGR